MQPLIQPCPRLLVAGFSFFGDPFHSHAGWTETNEIGRLWQRLFGFLTSPANPYPQPSVSYEIHLQNHETPRTGEFEVFAGFEIPDLARVPPELCVKVLPAGDYALFTLRGDQIVSDEPIFDCWANTSGYRQAFPFFAQRYDARFKGLDRLAESELDVLVPVARNVPDAHA